MKAFTLAFTLVTVLLVSPVFGQQPTDKPEIPPWDGAIFAHGVTCASTHAEGPVGTLRLGSDASDPAIGRRLRSSIIIEGRNS